MHEGVKVVIFKDVWYNGCVIRCMRVYKSSPCKNHCPFQPHTNISLFMKAGDVVNAAESRQVAFHHCPPQRPSPVGLCTATTSCVRPVSDCLWRDNTAVCTQVRNPDIFLLFDRSDFCAITPKHPVERRTRKPNPGVVILHRHSSCHLIFFAWGGRGWASVRYTYRKISCTWMKDVFLHHMATQILLCSSLFQRFIIFLNQTLIGCVFHHLHRSSFCNKHWNVFLLQPSSSPPIVEEQSPPHTNMAYCMFSAHSQQQRKKNVSIILRSRSCFRFSHTDIVLARCYQTNPPEYLAYNLINKGSREDNNVMLYV